AVAWRRLPGGSRRPPRHPLHLREVRRADRGLAAWWTSSPRAPVRERAYWYRLRRCWWHTQLRKSAEARAQARAAAQRPVAPAFGEPGTASPCVGPRKGRRGANELETANSSRQASFGEEGDQQLLH